MSWAYHQQITNISGLMDSALEESGWMSLCFRGVFYELRKNGWASNATDVRNKLDSVFWRSAIGEAYLKNSKKVNTQPSSSDKYGQKILSQHILGLICD